MDTIFPRSSVASVCDRGTMYLGAFVLIVAVVVGFYVLVGKEKRGMPPGPAPLPVVGNLLSLGLHPHQAMAQLAKQYGSVMRLFFGSVQVVVVSDAGAARELFSVSDASFASRPIQNLLYTPGKYMGAEEVSLGLGLFTPRVRELRQICISELFTAKELETRGSVRREEIHRTVGVFKALAAGGPVAFRPVVFELGSRNSCRALFNKAFVHLEEFGLHPSVLQKWVQVSMQLFTVTNLGDIIPAFRLVEKLDVQGLHARWRNVIALRSTWTTSIVEWYRKHAQSDETDKDFVEKLLQLHANEDGEKDTDIANKSLIAELLGAGPEPTSAAIEWTILELVRHPDILRRLREEIDAQFGMLRTVEEDEAAQLPYLQAVVKEAFRLHPPGALGFPHCNVEEAKLAGFQLAAETPVMANIWAIHRDVKAWGDDALVFNPDRFLGCDVSVNGTHFHFIPFGAGRRICPGRALAMRTVSTFVGSFVHAFEFSADTSLDNKEGRGNVSILPRTPLRLQIVLRPFASLYSVSHAS